jgi:hypothetical protein
VRKIPYEDSYSHWVSEGIVQFFKSMGYAVFHDTVGQPTEALVPLDRLYTVAPPDGRVYLFALQMKVPEGQRPMHWRLVRGSRDEQFRRIRQDFSDWIWYCLPYFQKPTWHGVALHLSHFARATKFCENAQRVVSLPGNFLLSTPTCGPHCPMCHEWLHFCRHERCCEHHDDTERRRLGRVLRHLDRHDVECLCAFSSPDSWGTFLTKLLLGQAGHLIACRDDLQTFIGDHLPPGLLEESAVVVAVSAVTGAVSVVSGFAGHSQENHKDDFPPFDDDAGEWPV